MGPGPSHPYPEVMQALARPVVGDLDPDSLGLLDQTCERLRAVLPPSNSLTPPVSGTGPGAPHGERPGAVAVRRAVAVVVSRPEHDQRLRGRRPQVPPHGADIDDLRPARGSRGPARGGPRRVVGETRGHGSGTAARRR